MSEKLILIDGHSILNRAFYGVPDLTNAEGIHTNALYGFLNILFKFLDEEKPDYIMVAFDLSAPTFRHKAFDGYKGTRKPMQPELKQQVPLMKELLKAMNITVVEQEGFEADDILGTIAKESAAKGIDVSIISGDRDLLQLADEHIKIRISQQTASPAEPKNSPSSHFSPDTGQEPYSPPEPSQSSSQSQPPSPGKTIPADSPSQILPETETPPHSASDSQTPVKTAPFPLHPPPTSPRHSKSDAPAP